MTTGEFFQAAKGGAAALLASLPLGAPTPTINDAPPETIVSTQGAHGVLVLITTVGGWMFGILVALAVILVLLAAFDFLFSGGDEKKVAEARDKLTYALVAVGVAILARGIILLIGVLFDTAL